jgi:hypothetical protein
VHRTSWRHVRGFSELFRVICAKKGFIVARNYMRLRPDPQSTQVVKSVDWVVQHPVGWSVGPLGGARSQTQK